MPGQIITAREEGSQFVVRVHLDTAKEIGAPDARQPDPDWVVEEVHALDVDPQAATRQTVLKARDELKARQAGPKPRPLPDRLIEGLELDLLSVSDEPPPPKAPTEAEAQQPHPHLDHPKPVLAPGDEENLEHPGTTPLTGDRTRDGMPRKGG